jgi:hypothetical protein
MTTYDVCEGVEDALSIWMLERGRAIIGVPGVGAIQHLDLKKGDSVLVWKDGDEEGSAAAKVLTAGVDTLLLNDIAVRVTRTPPDADANIILQKQGLDALRELAARPPEAMLSFNGHIIQLSRITDAVAFAKKRKAIAEVFKSEGIGVGVVDDEVKKLRRAETAAAAAAASGDEGSYEPPKDPEWEGEVDLGAALDSAVAAMPRFLVAPAYVYDTTALWSANTYLVQSEEIGLPVAPQLGFQSLVENSGKSVAIEIVATIAHRGYLRASYTAATLFRRINQDLVTPCLSEFHNILGDKDKDLLAIIDACHRRSEAYVDRTETDPQGKRYVVSYKCWASLAWGAIGAVPREAQSRSIILFLQAALPDESHALDHSIILQDKALIDVRRQLAKWSVTIKKLPTPEMPKFLFNRAADNFRPLFAIAQLAGGDWPQRIRDAAEAISKIERKPSLQVRLLTGITGVLEPTVDKRLATGELIDALCEDEENGWQEANHGKRINEYWLRENLRGLIDPPGSLRWREGSDESDPKIRGYALFQFNDAVLRYLPPKGGTGASGPSGPSGPEPSKPSETADVGGPDAESDPAPHPAHSKPRKSATDETTGPDGPDGPDENPPPLREKEEGATSETASPAGNPEQPNGPLADRKSRRSTRINDAIRETARQHPDWNPTQIGKKCGRAESVVRHILGMEAKP